MKINDKPKEMQLKLRQLKEGDAFMFENHYFLVLKQDNLASDGECLGENDDEDEDNMEDEIYCLRLDNDTVYPFFAGTEITKRIEVLINIHQ